MRVRRLAAAAAALALLSLSACSEEGQQAVDDTVASATQKAGEGVESAKEELAKVDWEKYGAEAKKRLDNLAEKADCQALQKELSTVEANDLALTRYIKQLIAEANCPA